MQHRWPRAGLGCSVLLAIAVGCGERAASEGESAVEAAPGVDELVLASAKVAMPVPAPGDLPDPASEGAQYLRQYCTACHGLASPQTHSATDWPVVLRRMWIRTEGVAGDFNLPVPTPRERVVMLNYLLDNALEVSRTELPPGPGRQLFSRTCTRCHELPDPRQHTRGDWAAVVIRMRQHMVQMLSESPPQSEVQEIILYLERASRS